MGKESECKKLETKDGYPVIKTLKDVEISHSMPPVILTEEQIVKMQRESEEKRKYIDRVYWSFYHKVDMVSFMNTISDSTDNSKEKISLSIRQINEKLSSVKNDYTSAKNETRGKHYQIRKATEGKLLEYYQCIVNELREKKESLKRQFNEIERYFPAIPTTKTAKPVQTIEPIRWIGEKSLLPTFINDLKDNGFIDRTISTTEIIEQHFSDKGSKDIKPDCKSLAPKAVEPIQWIRKPTQLCYLFKALQEAGLFVKVASIPTTIKKHFPKEIAKNIDQVYQNILNADKPRGKDAIDEIVNNAKKSVQQ